MQPAGFDKNLPLMCMFINENVIGFVENYAAQFVLIEYYSVFSYACLLCFLMPV